MTTEELKDLIVELLDYVADELDSDTEDDEPITWREVRGMVKYFRETAKELSK